MGFLRRFIESKSEKVKALRAAALLASFYAGLHNIKIMGVALFIAGIGSIWRYREQSAEEHALRFLRATFGLALVVM